MDTARLAVVGILVAAFVTEGRGEPFWVALVVLLAVVGAYVLGRWDEGRARLV